jgi:hypothetical protein
MAYAALDSPLPGLTVSPTGERCCGVRGYQPGAHALLGMLGDTPIFDTSSTDPTGSLIDPTAIDQPAPIIDLTPPIETLPPIIDTTSLPLPNQLSPSVYSSYPSSVGTEFTSNGDGTYTNIQTGQTVPYNIAEQISAATAGAPAVDTTATGQNLTITDASGATSSVNTNNLTVAAQALQAAGQLVNAAGKLTAQGQALLNGGNLYKPAPVSTNPFSGAMSSLSSWMSGSTFIPGVPNMVVGLVAIAGLIGLSIAVQDRPKKRRR